MSASVRSSSSRPQYKTMSVSVRRLQEALNMHLDVKEKASFVEVLNKYHISRDIPKFVKNLKKILDTPAKKQMFALIRKVIPKGDLADFDQCLRLDGRKFDTAPAKRSKYLPQKPRTSLPLTDMKKLPKKLKQRDKSPRLKEDTSTSRESDSSKSSKGTLGAHSMRSIKSLKSAVKGQGSEVKNIQIRQSAEAEKGFGFSIRGGAEFGIGIYVSMVDKGGMAEKEGLLAGDLIMEVNDIAFEKIAHNDAAQIVRSARKLDMKICRVGRIPGTFVVHQMYKWVDPHGRPVTPPPELENLGQTDSVGRKSGFSLLKASDECKVNVKVGEGQSLGLMIRGGREFGLGIYISGVDAFSLADDAGLKVGDQILDVNGQSFLDISHAEAVRILKVTKHLIFTIKDVGKLPYARTKIDQTSWLNHPRVKPPRHRLDSQKSDSTMASSSSSAFTKGIGSQLMLNTAISSKWDLIENQATQLLNEVEQGTLRYYLSEYQRGFITVDGLAMASFELLNTKAKMTMMSEIRNWVRPRDLDKFDILLQRREARQREGFLSKSYDSTSLGRPGRRGHNPGVLVRTTMSAPTSRAATVRSRPPRRHPTTVEMEMDPLRRAIEQIEDDLEMPSEHELSLQSSRLRSFSSDQLHSPNLLKSSVSSRRSLSQETLIPVYIDTTSDLPPRQRTSKHASQRPRSAGASLRHRFNSYSHRQRAGSNSSTLRRRHKSMEDVRQQFPRRSKTGTISSRHGSEVDVRSQLSSASYTHLKYEEVDYPDSPEYAVSSRSPRAINVVQAEVHQQPRTTDGIPSDDSGVEVNGINGHDNINNRVTISSDNPVNIDDVLTRRSSIMSLTTDLDLGNMSNPSNTSTLTSHRSRSKRPGLEAQTYSTHSLDIYPPEIRLNDGEGSIDTISVDNPPSPKFVSQSRSMFYREAFASPEIKRKSKSIRKQSSYDADDEPETFDVQSDVGDSDLYVSPLDRVLDEEDDSYSDVSTISDHSYNTCRKMDGVLELDPIRIPRPKIYTNVDLAIIAKSEEESQQTSEAKKKYGDIPLDIIPVYKTKPTLGMAIEGGANTRQPLPRVINLQPGGSAYESGGLKVGHVILEVNGKSLVGLEHITAAKAIAEAFKNKAQDNMELLVTESGVRVKNQP